MTEIIQARWVALTRHFWTSTKFDSYLGVTAHFISPEWQLVAYILCAPNKGISHTAKHMAERLQSVVLQWGVTAKFAGFTHGNDQNLVAALNKLKWPHIPCIDTHSELVFRWKLHKMH